MNKEQIIEVLKDRSTNIDEQQFGGIDKAVLLNDFEDVADSILILFGVVISKAEEYTKFIIISDRKGLPLISFDDYIKRY